MSEKRLKSTQKSETKRLAAEKLLAEAKDKEDVANALVDLFHEDVTPEKVEEIQRFNKAYFDELSTVQADYEVDITDPARQKAMLDFETGKLTQFAYALYGEVGLKQIKSKYGRGESDAGAVRSFFQNFDGDQCKGALATTNPFRAGQSPCWICGFTIPVYPPASRSGFSMECEHVFPIAQAVFFIDLYRGRDTPAATIQKVQKEYDWAHRVCNQVKNDLHFVRVTGAGGNKTWGVASDAEFASFLNRLYDGSGNYFKGESKNLLKDAIGPNKGQWIKDRTVAIRDRIKEVLDVGVNQCVPGIFTIIQVDKCLQMYETQITGARRKTRRKRRGRKPRVGHKTRRRS